MTLLSVTPETHIHSDSSPLTSAWDPANIDRRSLVGVGELATPHFDRRIRRPQENPADGNENPHVLQEEDIAEVDVVPNVEPDGPDTPWTIEAVDGELDDQVRFFFLVAEALLAFTPPARRQTVDTDNPPSTFNGRRERGGRDSLPSSAPWL